MSLSYLIVEIKARCRDAQAARNALRSRGAGFKGTDRQLDTYFRVRRGRLKLREGDIENALIFYERPDQPSPKESRVILCPRPGDPLKEVLTAALGVLVVVAKRREIYFIGNVKFHIDELDGLGSFLEIEAIDETGTVERDKLRAQCRKYMADLGVDRGDLMECSYSDMLLELV